MIDELEFPEFALCPDVNSIKVQGGELGDVHFGVIVLLLGDTKIDNT